MDADILRRAAVLAAHDPRVSSFELQRELHIDSGVADRIMDQLATLGLVRHSPSREGESENRENNKRPSAIKAAGTRRFVHHSLSVELKEAINALVNAPINNEKIDNTIDLSNNTKGIKARFEKNKYIEKIDSSLSEDLIRSLIEEALSPLLGRTELSKAQKSEIIRASSASLKSCLHNDHGASVGNELIFPDIAPAMWKQDRVSVVDPVTSAERLEDAREFTKRVYGPWLGNGLTRNMLRKLDNPLFQALYRAYGTNLPDDLPLPTKKDENDRWVARVEQEGLASVIPEGASPKFVLKEASRLEAARHRRKQK